jgi:hypothetical protein
VLWGLWGWRWFVVDGTFDGIVDCLFFDPRCLFGGGWLLYGYWCRLWWFSLEVRVDVEINLNFRCVVGREDARRGVSSAPSTPGIWTSLID